VTLRERLQQDTVAAMRSGDSLRRDVLRMAINAINNAEKAKLATLTDDEVLSAVLREVKMRRESIEAFRGGGREDLATKEEGDLAILNDYLPQALTDDELRALINEAIAATDAASARDMGKVMGWLSPKIKGKADGKVASGLVAAALARADLTAHGTGH
jgi:uncharacterized protein YqeY